VAESYLIPVVSKTTGVQNRLRRGPMLSNKCERNKRGPKLNNKCESNKCGWNRAYEIGGMEKMNAETNVINIIRMMRMI
jgi:hypothetical protein